MLLDDYSSRENMLLESSRVNLLLDDYSSRWNTLLEGIF